MNIIRKRDLLDDETKRKLNVNVHSSMTRKQIHHEQLTREDYEFLMGMYRDVYKRVNGRIRRK